MRDKIFISYSHKDIEYLKRLQTHLVPFEYDNKIEFWDDTRINSGNQWRAEIDKAIQETVVAILLITPDFLASRFITENELTPLIDACQAGKAKLIPVIIKHSVFLNLEKLCQFQSINDPNEPLYGLSPIEQDKLWVKVAVHARMYYEEMMKKEDVQESLDEWLKELCKQSRFLHKNDLGQYYGIVKEKRDNVPPEYRCYRLNKLVHTDTEPIEGESHWIFYRANQFKDLSKNDKILFSIYSVSELKNWPDGLENARNIYPFELFLLKDLKKRR